MNAKNLCVAAAILCASSAAALAQQPQPLAEKAETPPGNVQMIVWANPTLYKRDKKAQAPVITYVNNMKLCVDTAILKTTGRSSPASRVDCISQIPDSKTNKYEANSTISVWGAPYKSQSWLDALNGP
jgi:hypothetical protein